nr:hypothetical protein Iba_chr12eCG7460 [Ipomoea batatas]
MVQTPLTPIDGASASPVAAASPYARRPDISCLISLIFGLPLIC